jgi:hypothetical protein
MSADIAHAHPPVRSRRIRKMASVGIAIVSALTLLGLTPLPASPAGAAIHASKASAGNGYLIMIHSTFEPHGHPVVDGTNTGRPLVDQLRTGIEYAPGAVGATREGDSIVFRAVAFTVAAYPVIVGQPQLEVDGVGGGRRLLLQPNLPPENDPRCQFETHWDGHEGPVEACSVYQVPAGEFDNMPVVSLTLHFVDAKGAREEVHNLLAHDMLHNVILGAPVDLKTVDAVTTEPTPLVMENVIDTKRPMAWRGATAGL